MPSRCSLRVALRGLRGHVASSPAAGTAQSGAVRVAALVCAYALETEVVKRGRQSGLILTTLFGGSLDGPSGGENSNDLRPDPFCRLMRAA